MKKKILSILLSLCMLLALVPAMGAAAQPVQVGDLLVEGGKSGVDYILEGSGNYRRLTIKTATPLTIKNVDSSEATSQRISIESSGGANITLAGVNIAGRALAALSISGDSGNVNITLAEGSENILTGGGAAAGLSKNLSSDEEAKGRLTISGSGKLTANGAWHGAGIGGNSSLSTADIVINGGTIIANGGAHAAGIGGGIDGSAKNITINGGTVIATGRDGGAGIGGGGKSEPEGCTGTNITINGGTVIAKALGSGAGIGGGRQGEGRDITIGGGVVTATSLDSGAGIGGGYGAEGKNIVIYGGSVKAKGGPKYNASDIGGGGDSKPAVPTNSREPVYLFKLINTGNAPVKIDNRTYPANHSAADENDKALYAYLTAGDHIVVVGGREIRYKFDSASGTFRTDMSVSLNGWMYGERPNTPTTKLSGVAVRAEYKYVGRNSTVYAESGEVPTDVGDYTVIAQFDHVGNIFTASSDFSITKKSIGRVYIALGTAPVYDGTEHAAPLEIDDNGDALVQGKDYTVSGGSAVNAGSYTLTVEGMGNYSGTESLTWKIEKAEPERSHFSITVPAPVAYDGMAKSVAAPTFAAGITNPGSSISVYYEGTDGTSYLKSESAPTKIGKYMVTFAMDGNGSNLDATWQDIEIGVLEITEAEHVWDAGTVRTNPTCTAPGEKVYTCLNDPDHVKTEPLPALGHDIRHHDAKAPTCTEAGWDAYETCARCDYTTYKELPALGHDLKHHDAKASTCTDTGWDAYDTCTRCDYTTYKELPALGHDLKHHDAKAPTCTEAGWGEYDTCTRCDYTTYKELPIDADNHSDMQHVDASPATVEETGNIEYWHCGGCDKYFADADGKNEISPADTILAKLKPEIIDGMGQSVTEGEKKALAFRSNAPFADFISVEIDGKTLDESNYTAADGSTLVTLSGDYVATLKAGEHKIGIVSEGGTAETTFTVNEKKAPAAATTDATAKPTSPKSGESLGVGAYLAMLIASITVFACVMIYGKKKNYFGK